MTPTIRICTPGDIAVMVHTIRSSFKDIAERFGLTAENAPRHPSNCAEDWIRKDMERRVIYFILDNGESVAGCVALERVSPDVCYLERLAVLPDQRRQGFGEALVSHVLSTAALLGAHRVSIGIIADHFQYEGLVQAPWIRRGREQGVLPPAFPRYLHVLRPGPEPPEVEPSGGLQSFITWARATIADAATHG